MCTVILLQAADGGYWLASNRDERVTRGIASAPDELSHKGSRVFGPRDPDAGGSWVATDPSGRTLCLLNGEDTRAPAAREAPSRGVLLLDLFAEWARGARPEDALRSRQEQGLLLEKPFALLVAEPASGRPRLRRVLWDGDHLEHEVCATPHLEVSHGLDRAGARLERGEQFRSLRGASILDERVLLDWLRSHSEAEPGGGPRTVCMHHHLARTVSSTVIRVDHGSIRMTYRPGQPCEEQPLVHLHRRRQIAGESE